ncbi:MAG: hypothetical protein U0235_00295 [Polyangiaceae bacterium]
MGALSVALVVWGPRARADEPVTRLADVPRAEVPAMPTARPVSATGKEPPIAATWVDAEHRPQVLEARDGCFVGGPIPSETTASLVMPDAFRLVRIEQSPVGAVLVVEDGWMDGRMQTHAIATTRVPLAIVARAEDGGGVAYAYRTSERLVVVGTFGSPPPANELPECRLVELSLDVRRAGGDEAHVEHAPRRFGKQRTVGSTVRLYASTSRVRADGDTRLAVGMTVVAPVTDGDEPADFHPRKK